MGESLTAAAAAMGIPEPLVERSAEARASASGASVEDLLGQWAGGEGPPVVAKPAEVADTDAGDTEDAPVEESAVSEPTPEIVIEVPEPSTPLEPVPAGPYRPPVLVGAEDSPMTVLAAVVGLFLVVVLVGLVGPSIPIDNAGARTSQIGFTDLGIDGREIYETTGCASCHTQMVRPIMADVGLGAVTLNDTNQVLGTRRFGPDLSNVGTRLSADEIESIIGGLNGHPTQDLDPGDMSALVAYLSESRTSAPGEAGS